MLVDIEATSGANGRQGGTREVIEIGAAVIENGAIVQNESILVRAGLRKVSDFCFGICAITQAEVDDGIISIFA